MNHTIKNLKKKRFEVLNIQK